MTRLPRPRTGVPGVIWAITAFFALLLTCWSFLVPTYRAPDEPMHVSTALRIERGGGYPPPGVPRVEPDVLASVVVAGTPLSDEWFRLVPLVGEDAPAREDRPSFADLDAAPPLSLRDQMTQHPPLYYLLAAGVLALVPDTVSFFVEVHALRLLGVLLTSVLPLCAFLATRRVLGRDGPAVAAAMVPLGIPMLTHIGSVASNDTLLMALFGVVTVAVAHIATGDLSRRTAALTGVVVALALLTKASGLVALLWVLLAYAVAAWRTGGLRAVRAPVGLFAVLSALGGWWWVLNAVRYGTVQPNGFLRPAAAEEPVVDALFWLQEYLRGMTATFWASFGWREVVGTLALRVLASLGLAGLVVLGLAAARGWRVVALLLVVPLATLAGLVARASWVDYGYTGGVHGVQGRYVFPAVVALAALAAAGLARVLGRHEVWLPPALLAVALGLQAVGLRTAVRGFWAPDERSLAASLDVMLLWGPWPPAVQVAVLVAAGVAAAGLVVLTVHRAVAADRVGGRVRAGVRGGGRAGEHPAVG